MKKFINKSYSISSDKIKNDISISLFADIHYSNILKKEILEQIKTNLIEQKPNYICIPGDIIDMSNILDNKKKSDDFLNFFNEIGELADVFVSLGSHDFSRLENGRWRIDYNKKWFEKLNNIKNVHLLHNSIYEGKDIRFIGYTPTYEYYYNELGHEDEDILINDYIYKMPKVDNKKLNVLLCHTPICILNDKCIKNIDNLKNMRLILAGHMHNGLVPEIVDRCVNNSVGLIAPNKSLFPKNTRGIINKKIDENDVSMIVTGGITKIQESAPKILHFTNNFFKGQMDTINIKSL